MWTILTKPTMGETSLPIISAICGATVEKNNGPLSSGNDVIRWGCTTAYSGGKTLNKATAIKAAYNKGLTREALYKAGLSMPTFTNVLDTLLYFGENWPVAGVLVRPIHHSRSVGMHVCKTPKALAEAVMAVGGEFYASKIIDKAKEFRVFVAKGRVVWVLEKHPKSTGELSWGCVEEGEFDYVGWSNWPIGVCKKAIQSLDIPKLDFGAVDVIVEKGTGEIYVLEINTAPYLSKYYAKTVGKAFKYIMEHPDEPTDLPSGTLNWKNIIHPSLKGT